MSMFANVLKTLEDAPTPEVDPNDPLINPEPEDDTVITDDDGETAVETLGMDAELIGDVAAIEAMVGELGQMQDLQAAIESHGMHASLVAFIDPEGLMSSTSTLGLVALENLAEPVAAYDEKAIAATEAIGETIKNAAAAVAAKVTAAATKVWEKLSAGAKFIGEKATAMAGWLKDKTVNAAAWAKATVKAHPYATIAVALAAVTGLAAVGVAVWGGGLPTTAAAASSWVSNILSKLRGVNAPSGVSITVPTAPQLTGPAAMKALPSPSSFMPTVATEASVAAPAAQSVSKLGWGIDKVKSVLSSVKELFTSGGAIGKFLSAVRNGATSLPGKINGLAGEALRIAKWALLFAVMVTLFVMRVISDTIMLKMMWGGLKKLFGAIKRLVTGGSKAEGGEAAPAAA